MQDKGHPVSVRRGETIENCFVYAPVTMEKPESCWTPLPPRGDRTDAVSFFNDLVRNQKNIEKVEERT